MKKILSKSLLYGFSFALLGCGALPAVEGNSTGVSDGDGAVSNNQGVSVNKPLVIPPSVSGDVSKNGGENALSGNLPNLNVPKGLKLEALFLERTDDDVERFERLENALVDFRKEYDEAKPAIIRLVAIEEDMKNLINELERFVQDGGDFYDAQTVAPVSEKDLSSQMIKARDENAEAVLSPASMLNDVDSVNDKSAINVIAMDMAHEDVPTTVISTTNTPSLKIPKIGTAIETPVALEKKTNNVPQIGAPVQMPQKSSNPVSNNAASLVDGAIAKSSPKVMKQESEKLQASVGGVDKTQTVLRNIRIGEHARYTRFVLDIDKKVGYELDLDTQEDLLVISLNGVTPAASMALNKTFAHSSLLSSYTVNVDGQITRVILSLKKDTEIVKKDILGPKSKSNFHRLFIDLKK